MRKPFLFTMLLVALLLHACSASQSPPIEQEVLTAIVSQPESSEDTAEPAQNTVTDPLAEASPVVETDATNCLGGETSLIAESIAEEYNFTDYTEVVSWFCDGAEFEDILVALETESQTGTPAEEMLQMLADGFSWDEIWQFVGLTE